MEFNPARPSVMHVDINSCFATIEQQANPLLRGRPIAVVAYDSPSGVILAASIEAKKYGVKTGLRLSDGRSLIPNLISVSPDPDKYRFVHKKLNDLLDNYCPSVVSKSIDEFALDFRSQKNLDLVKAAHAIKQDIRTKIGEWISVSIGISTNRQLAKVAAGMIKPDGLVGISKNNFKEMYQKLKLKDLNGINIKNEIRLNAVGIHTVTEFYNAPLWKLKAAFRSVNASYWYSRLRGYEVDSIEFTTKSIGHSYSIPQNLSTPRELAPILAKLVNKAATRLRKQNFAAYGVHVATTFKRGGLWHHGERLPNPIFYTSDIFANAFRILNRAKILKPVHTLSVTCYDLVMTPPLQLSIFENAEKKKFLAESMDKINTKFGNFVLMTGNMADAGDVIKDRIAFGK